MFEKRISDAMRAEEDLPVDPLERYIRLDEHRRKRQALDEMANRRLSGHVRAALPEDYDLRASLWNISIELHGNPGARLSIRFASNPRTRISVRSLEDFANCKSDILVIRHGRGYSEVGDLIDHLHDAHQAMQVVGASGRSVWLPGVPALDDFLGRLKTLLEPRLKELRQARRRNRIRRLASVLFRLTLTAVAFGLAGGAVFRAWTALTSS